MLLSIVAALFLHATPVGAETNAAEISQTLATLRLEGSYGRDEELRAELQQAGVTEPVLQRWLEILFRDCLAHEKECADSAKPSVRAAADRALGLTELLGTRSSIPLLERLDARLVSLSSLRIRRILEREYAAAAQACPPPSDEEVRRAAQKLAGYQVLAPDGGTLTPRPPSATELNDLAYFVAATEGEGAGVGEATTGSNGNWMNPGPPNADRKSLVEQERAARRAGDLEAVARLAREYLGTLGFPGELRTAEEHSYGWGGPRWADVMRDLALADETLGRFDEAAAVYRRANPGGGACGTSVGYLREEQTKGLIRSADRAGKCRSVVAERMIFRSEQDRQGLYGIAPLRRAGFDIERLYRGALVTLNHRGAENWEARTHALEGWTELSGRTALPTLLGLARHGDDSLRLRALHTLGELARFESSPTCDPSGCDGTAESGSITFGDAFSSRIRPLGASCDPELNADDHATLTVTMEQLLGDPSWPIRRASAEVLGEVGTPASIPALRAHVKDGAQDGEICDSNARHCKPFFPVRDSAKEAIARIEQRTKPGRPLEMCLAARAVMASFPLETPRADPRLAGSPVEGLLDPKRRDATFCELARQKLLRPGAHATHCSDDHERPIGDVVLAPQPDGPPLVVVFRPIAAGVAMRPGFPRGGFTVFDHDGYQLPIFEGADLVDGKDAVFNPAGGRVAVATMFQSNVGGRVLQMFHVFPIARTSEPMLSVALKGPAAKRAEDAWTWRLAADGAGQPPRIELGTLAALAKNSPAAIYRWSNETNQYEGPGGAGPLGFVRIPREALEHMGAYLRAHP
jgi:hypothetical protein